MGLPLHQIIGSIINEFGKASTVVDLNREYLRETYQQHPFLKDDVPARIRVAQASISIPLAFESIGKRKVVPQEISRRQIRTLVLADKDTIPNPDEVAATILSALKKDKRARLDNKNLVEHIASAAKVAVTDFTLSEVNIRNLEELQESFRSQPPAGQEPHFVFETLELEKIPSDRIFRMEFKLEID